MTTPKQKLKELKLTRASRSLGRGCEVKTLPSSSIYADEAINIRHKGWFTDESQDAVYRGQVWELADDAERKPSIFVAGYDEGNGYANLSCSHGKLDLFDNMEEAARAADDLAERFAREASEYSARWQEAASQDYKREQFQAAAKDAREQWRALSRAIKSEMSTETWEKLKQMRDQARAKHRAAVAIKAECSERIASLGMEGEF